MNKFAITIARQYGSGGILIGKKLSEDLQVALYDKNLIELAAQKSGLCKEFIKKSDEKLPLSGFLSGIGDAICSGFGIEYARNINDEIFKIQSEIIRSLAQKESAIFLGRCADYVLREHKNILKIFVCANLEDRVKTVMQLSSISEKEALKEIEQNDKQRDRYYRHYTNIERGSAKYYDLCVNTSSLGIEASADFVKEFAVKKLK